jgi:hypothetical protein
VKKAFWICLFLVSPVRADVDDLLYFSLRDVHDRGAELFNAGDHSGAYRMFQGGLIVAKSALDHRPSTQKKIADGLKEVDEIASIEKRAFKLHELIESVRNEIRVPLNRGPQQIGIAPREIKNASVQEVKDGAVGRVFWQGKPVANVEVAFVTLGMPEPRVFETTTNDQGAYRLDGVKAGKYLVVLRSGQSGEKWPERYLLTTSTPLRFDVKSGGEKIDLILQ